MKFDKYEHDDITYDIIIGTSAKENWDIIDMSLELDLWFHVDEFPSAHVILKNPDDTPIKKIPKSVIKRCACLCKTHSKQASVEHVKIIYTQIKNVSKADIVGSVHVINKKSIVI
jgi:predicted ribosome quality control (RQC) complex YloA/Tae2 family protein